MWLFILRRIRKNCEKRLLASSRVSVRLLGSMEKLGSQWTDFDEILYLSHSRKSDQNLQD
jgi:hypothetical protein